MISPRLCPICDKALGPEVTSLSACFPFCSRRCQQIDLMRWCHGNYAIVDPLGPDQMNELLQNDPESLPEGWDLDD